MNNTKKQLQEDIAINDRNVEITIENIKKYKTKIQEHSQYLELLVTEKALLKEELENLE